MPHFDSVSPSFWGGGSGPSSGGGGPASIQGVSGGVLGASQIINFNSQAKEIWLIGTLSANLTVTLQNRAAGAKAKLFISQPASGGPYTLTVSDGTNSYPLDISSSNGLAWVEVDCPDTSNIETLVVSGGAASGPANWVENVMPQFGYTAVQGTWSSSFSNSYFLGLDIENGTTHAVNDAASWVVDLSAGTWTFYAIGILNGDGGQVQFSLDGTNFGAVWDQYHSGILANQTYTASGIVVASSGKHTLTATMPTKNASSTGYSGRFSFFKFLRTA